MLRILCIGIITVSAFGIAFSFFSYHHIQNETRKSQTEFQTFLQEFLKRSKETPQRQRTNENLKDKNLESAQPKSWEEAWVEIRDSIQNHHTDPSSSDETLQGISTDTLESTTELHVSPFGFGPYPEIPEDYPYDVAWETLAGSNISPERKRTFELLSRVRVKLWKQGDRDVIGLKLDSAQKVYLIYPRTVYLRYRQHEKIGDGSDGFLFGHGVSADTLGGSDISPSEHTRIAEGEKPQGIRILDYDSSGFDPYEFLGLNK